MYINNLSTKLSNQEKQLKISLRVNYDVEEESHRQVTFSKRRAGLFKKASELCTLCGADIAIIVFSPAKKPFSFGHPSVESVLDRYLSRNNLSLAQTQPQGNLAPSCELNLRLTHILSEVDEEKKKGQAIEEMRKANAHRTTVNWWEKPVEEMNIAHLEEMKFALEEMRKALFSETTIAPFNEVKEDVFGFLDKKVTNPYVKTSSYSFGYVNGCF